MTHTISELYQLQALSLESKILMTKQRIKAWVDRYGEENCYVSFSGGKDSRVLLDIVREMYPDIPAVYADTGLEYPEIRDFVKTFDNVTWVKPKMNFKEVIQKYGYPMISKEVAEAVEGARKYLKNILTSQDNEKTLLTGQDRTGQDRTGQDRTGQDRTGVCLSVLQINRNREISDKGEYP